MGEIAEVFKDDEVKAKFNLLVEALLVTLNADGSMKSGLVFVDRGNRTSWDYRLVNLTTNGAWHLLDISGIVPTEARAVLLRVRLEDNAANSYFSFRTFANTGTHNTSAIYTQVANIPVNGDLVCPIDSDGKLGYQAKNVVWTSIDILVKGWWL